MSEQDLKTSQDATQESQQVQQTNDRAINTKTHEDIFKDITKDFDSEIVKEIESTFSNRFTSNIANQKIKDFSKEVLSAYSEKKAEILAEKKAQEKFETLKNQYESGYKEFLTEHSISELTEVEIKEITDYVPSITAKDVETIKSNPLIAKTLLETAKMQKAKNQPLPKNTGTSEISINELKELEIKKEMLLDKKRNKINWKPSDAIDLDTISNKIILAKRKFNQ